MVSVGHVCPCLGAQSVKLPHKLVGVFGGIFVAQIQLVDGVENVQICRIGACLVTPDYGVHDGFCTDHLAPQVPDREIPDTFPARSDSLPGVDDAVGGIGLGQLEIDVDHPLRLAFNAPHPPAAGRAGDGQLDQGKGFAGLGWACKHQLFPFPEDPPDGLRRQLRRVIEPV